MKCNIPLNKGKEFEYQICNLFQNQGYLTRRAIPLQYGKTNNFATDIDVFGIAFSAPFKNSRIICDVKNRVRSNPHERVFWAKGLGEFTKANEVYVALPNSSWEFIKFASKGKVRVITSDMVEQSLKNAYKYGQADETFYTDYFANIDQVLKNDKKADAIINIIRKLYLKENPYSTLNVVLSMLEYDVSKQLKLADSLPKNILECWKYICCELTVLLSVQILLICSDVLGLPKIAREKQIIEKLSYGDMQPEKIREILNNAEAYANLMVKEKIPQSLIPQGKIIDFGPITSPSYANDIVGLIERAFNNPDIYISLPQLLDFLLFEQVLKGKEFSDLPYREVFKYSLPDEKLKSVKNIIAFIRDKMGINWDVIWTKINNSTTIKENNETREKQFTKENNDQQAFFNINKS